MKKNYTVYSKPLARKLCLMGFRLIRTEINDIKPWFYVYHFENSPELREEIAKWKEEKKNGQ